MRLLKKGISFILALSMIMVQVKTVPVFADSANVVTLGADLSEEQKAYIFNFFGTTADDVQIITITNTDERERLGDYMPIEQIGTRTYSCAYVQPTFEGGIQVMTANMNYVTGNMISGALSTSGVENCNVLCAAPFEVSGTGALTGAMMAYEAASGETLSEDKKNLANKEIVGITTIAKTVGLEQATLIDNDIKIAVIRGKLKDRGEIEAAVSNVIEDVHEAYTNANGTAEVVQQDDKDFLVELGIEFSQLDYDYETMKHTLQRVTTNIVNEAGIKDPITDTFEDLGEDTIASDSILLGAGTGEYENLTTTYRFTNDFTHYCGDCMYKVPQNINLYEKYMNECNPQSEKETEDSGKIILKIPEIQELRGIEPDPGDGSRESLIKNIEAAEADENIAKYHKTTCQILQLAAAELRNGSTDTERIQKMLDAACDALVTDDNSLLDAFLDSDSTVATEEGRSIAGDNIYQNQETGITIIFPDTNWIDCKEYMDDFDADAVYSDGETCFLVYIADDLYETFKDAGYDYIAAEEIDALIDEEAIASIMGMDDVASIKQMDNGKFTYYVIQDSTESQIFGIVKNAILHLIFFTGMDENTSLTQSVGYEIMNNIRLDSKERF